MDVSVIMPCLNEERTLGFCIEKAKIGISKLGLPESATEILIADNGSTDSSVALSENLGARVVHVHKKGYGSALLSGITSARGTIVIMADSDDSYDFRQIPLFVEKINEGHDLVIGNRFRGGIEKGAMPPLNRYIGNPVLSGVGKLLYHPPFSDFHCGFRAGNREKILSLGLTSPGMEFASEMIIKATKQKLKMAEIPVTLSTDKRNRPPHLRPWQDGWRHLTLMVRERFIP